MIFRRIAESFKEEIFITLIIYDFKEKRLSSSNICDMAEYSHHTIV